MRTIPLTKGLSTIVDDDDFPYLSEFKWSASGRQGHAIAVRGVRSRKNNTQEIILMHRELIDAPEGVSVDHINGNSLDNRKINLRLATSSQNSANTRKHGDAAGSKFKGVSRRKRDGRFSAEICVNGVRRRRHGFATEEEAARQYNAWAVELQGDFCPASIVNNAAPDLASELRRQGWEG